MTQEEYAKIIAKNLKRIAYDSDKTQADISRDLKINKQTISSWFRGERTPRMDKIDLLCRYFNCKRSDIMEEHAEGHDEYYVNSVTAKIAQDIFDHPELRVLFDAARGVSPDNIQLAAEMLRRMKETNPDG